MLYKATALALALRRSNGRKPITNTCNLNLQLDSQDQPGPARLNTCQARACVWFGPLRFVPASANNWSGDFLLLNRKTALRHTVAGTWQAQLWLVLALGHARIAKLTGQQKRKTRGLWMLLSLLVFFFFSLCERQFTHEASRAARPFFGGLVLLSALVISFTVRSLTALVQHSTGTVLVRN
jgi:hypothetical protein